jgi:type VI secretion system secreted protein Hcp
MAIFMVWDDQSITGDATDQNFTKWIEISSFQWGIGRGIGPASSGSADREGTTPSVSEIVVTKTTDSASPNLLRASTGSPPVSKGSLVHIAFGSTGAAAGTGNYLQWDLENCLVSGWSVSSGGDRPTETVSLNFTKCTMTITPMNADGTAGTPDRPFYDLAQQVGG